LVLAEEFGEEGAHPLRLFGVDSDKISSGKGVLSSGGAMLEYSELKGSGEPNFGVYCGIRSGGSGIAGIGGGLDHLWYCRTFWLVLVNCVYYLT
jgi:hypothetical protein